MKWTSLLSVVWIAFVALTGCQRKPAGEVQAQPPAQSSPEAPAAQTEAPPEPSTPPEPPEKPPEPPEKPPEPPEKALEPPEKLLEPPVDPLATRIGFFVPLSGPQASFGLDAVSGAKFAVEEINAEGGVLDHPINLIVKDTESQTDKVGLIVTELIDTDEVAALIGEITTDRSLVAAPIAQERGIPMITPGATNEKVTAVGNCVFRACYTDGFQAAVMSKFAHSLDVEKIAIVYDASNPYGSSLWEAFKAEFLKQEGSVVAEETYSAGDADFSNQLNAVKLKNPDAIFLPSYYSDAALIIKQARQLGIEVPFLGTDAWDSNEFLKIGGSAVNNCYFASHFSSEHLSEKGKAFDEAYRAKVQVAPPPLAALAYDAVWLTADALKRAGSAEPAALRDALSATKDFPGVTGIITMGDDRNPKKPAIVIRVQDGKFTYLEVAEP